MSLPISPAALQSALVGGTPEASAALLDELKQANSLDALRAEYDGKIADLSGKLEAVTARLASLEGDQPQGNHWQAGYVASQANPAPAADQYAQPQNGLADFIGFMSGGK